MFFNFMVFVFIVLIMLYLSTQGVVSALLALVTAIFSSILAMGLMEPLQGLTAKWKPEHARGLTMLTVFLITFAITRIVADMVVPKSIKLPVMVNRVAAGFIGFFAALVVMGTLVVGIEMMPLPRTIMGYDRFPSETVMFDKDRPGEVSKYTSGVWFGPDRFVQAIWNAASGRGFGGQYKWSDIHPDLSVESYGYRNTAAVGSARVVLPDNFSVFEAWMTKDAKVFGGLGIKTVDPERPVIMVRTEVRNGGGGGGKGGGSGAGSAGAGGSADVGQTAESGGPYFRVTPTQVRLLTDKGNQYYPIGYMEQGRIFTPLPLDKGRVVDDFVNGSAVQDWIFQVKPDEKAAYIEMKQLARKRLWNLTLGDFVKEAPLPALALNFYPKKPYFKELSTLTVEVDLKGKKFQAGRVYLLTPFALKSDMSSEVMRSNTNIANVLEYIDNRSGGWTSTGQPGVKAKDFFTSARNTSIQSLVNADPSSTIYWSTALPVFLAGQMTANGEKNIEIYMDYFENTLEPMWRKVAKGDAIVQSAVLSPSGKTELTKINPGKLETVVVVKTEKGFFLWRDTTEFKASSNPTLKLSTDKTDFALDLEAKMPAPPAAAPDPAVPAEPATAPVAP